MADARDRLSATEGAPVSWRELVRRAGFSDVEFGRVSYHLLPRRRARGIHQVPGWLIDRLAPVLAPVVDRERLERAAAEAAGRQVDDHEPRNRQKVEQLVPMVLRVLDDEALDAAERWRIGLEAIAAITRAMQRELPAPSAPKGCGPRPLQIPDSSA